MEIEFSEKYTRDFNSMHLVFMAIFDSRNIKCIISQECLHDNFQANSLGEENAFLANRIEIESKAEKLIESGRFEKNGSIFIRTSDFS